MIERRELTYAWQSTANNSRSLKSEDGVLVGTNYVQNPSAEGATSSMSADAGVGAVAIVADTQTGPGAKSYKYTGPGATTYLWSGAPDASSSSMRVNGVTKFTNSLPNPSFRNGLTGYSTESAISAVQQDDGTIRVITNDGQQQSFVINNVPNNTDFTLVVTGRTYQGGTSNVFGGSPNGVNLPFTDEWATYYVDLTTAQQGALFLSVASPGAEPTNGYELRSLMLVPGLGYRGGYFDGSTVPTPASIGAVTTAAAAAPSTPWWFRTTVRLDPTVIGARSVAPFLRFYDTSGVLLQAVSGDKTTLTPPGVFNRWVGVAGASRSEQFSGTARRVNDVTNPSFRLNQAGWAVAENFTLTGLDTLVASANADVQSGALVAYTDPMPVTPGDLKSGRLDVSVDVSDDVPSQSLQALIRFYDAGGNLLYDVYGDGGDVTDTTTSLLLNGALAPTGSVTYRLALVTVDGTPTDTEITISRALVETSLTVGDYFDGDTASTGNGNYADTFDVSVFAVAPAGTATVRGGVLRVPDFGWEPDTDILYFDSLLLTISTDTTVPNYYDGASPDETIFVNVVRDGELTTDEWFEVDGAALNTYAYNITTSGGSRMSPPATRGANATVPGSPGTVYQKKELSGQTISLNMWVQGSEETGKIPTHSVVQQFKRNWNMLRKLLFHTRREMVITKRWLDWDTSEVLSATGKAEYAGGLEPTMTGPARAVFAVDLYMNDPFFYGEKKVITGSGSAQQKWTEEVPGDWSTTAITVSLAGPRVNPRIKVTTSEGDVTWVKYTGTIAKGDTVVLNVKDFSARLNRAAGGSSSVLGSVSNGGDKPWLVLGDGQNTILLESTSGTGATSISYIPVWF